MIRCLTVLLIALILTGCSRQSRDSKDESSLNNDKSSAQTQSQCETNGFITTSNKTALSITHPSELEVVIYSTGYINALISTKNGVICEIYCIDESSDSAKMFINTFKLTLIGSKTGNHSTRTYRRIFGEKRKGQKSSSDIEIINFSHKNTWFLIRIRHKKEVEEETIDLILRHLQYNAKPKLKTVSNKTELPARDSYLMNTIFGSKPDKMVSNIQSPSERYPKVHQLIKESGGFAMTSKMPKAVIQYIRKSVPNVPESVWRDMEKHLSVDEYNDILVKCYAKHITEQMADKILKEKDSVKKDELFSAYQQKISSDVKRQSSIWGRQAMNKISSDLKQAGYMPKEN